MVIGRQQPVNPNEAMDVDRMGRARAGDVDALNELLTSHRDRLLRMVQVRLDWRLRQRFDASDVVQESLVDAVRRFPEYASSPRAPFHAWLRSVVLHRLQHMHREHIGVQARDVRREVPLDRNGVADASTPVLAAALVDSCSSPSTVAARVETEARLRAAIDRLEAIDREILLLRHFEQFSNADTARLLGISESAATKRHLRALLRLRETVEGIDLLLSRAGDLRPA